MLKKYMICEQCLEKIYQIESIFFKKKKKNTIDFKRFLFHRIINSQVSK